MKDKRDQLSDDTVEQMMACEILEDKKEQGI
jgi:hypothetical protein